MFSSINKNKTLFLILLLMISFTINCVADYEKFFSLSILYFPKYAGKILEGNSYSYPFSIKVEIENADPFENLSIKAYIVENISNRYPATQIWDSNENKWSYSYYYIEVKANSAGYWSGWLHLRFKRDYREYYQNIWNSSSAWLKVKCRRENGNTIEKYKQILLLDLDNSTTNGFSKGGFVSGIAKNETVFFQNRVIIIENKNGTLFGVYLTENNNIDEDFPNIPGYYKLTAPVGSGYRVLIIDNNTTISLANNITINQGFYNFEIDSETINFCLKPYENLSFDIRLTNTGTLPEYIALDLKNLPRNWLYNLEGHRFYLDPGEEVLIGIEIHPSFQDIYSYLYSFNISGICEDDISIFYNLTVTVELKIPDLAIHNISSMRDKSYTNLFKEGEIAEIRAKVKNIGTENATNFNVTFYYDSLDRTSIIGYRHYSNITRYPKYPSINWDTKGLEEGCHRIYVVVDNENNVFEFNESNNIAEYEIFIEKSLPSEKEKRVVIIEVYYYTYKNTDNEFVTIYNPTSYAIDISGWYLTDTPCKRLDEQSRIIFPEGTILQPFSSICITQNATAYHKERGENPDYEYKEDSKADIPQVYMEGNFALNNNGDIIVLKDRYNHTIDVVLYGKTVERFYEGWNGEPIDEVKRGFILRRKFEDTLPIDTNTSYDWKGWRRWKIGQTDFKIKTFQVGGSIITFVSPDCSYEVLSNIIRSANRSIYVNMYEFTNPFLMDEIIGALDRNVSIKLLIEGLPAGGLDERERFILHEISKHGGEIRFIGGDKQRYCRYNFDHAKYLIIDNETVVIESANWGKTGIPVNNTFGNREWGIVLKNKTLASYLLEIFLHDYNLSKPDVHCYNESKYSEEDHFVIDYSIPNGFYIPRFRPMSIEGVFNVSIIISPDNSLLGILDLIRSATTSVYVEQLYIYRSWEEESNPLIRELINKSKSDINVKVILNYNPKYEYTNSINNETISYLRNNSIEVKYVYTNWSYFTNVHNKGIIVDNKSVLVSSINWNENSFLYNRELGIIVENTSIAKYFADVFIYDWNLEESIYNKSFNNLETFPQLSEKIKDYKNKICIIVIFVITAIIIALDWRRREW